jgi:lipopolysaccharide/colanic/teichoic acid biosynthesis glycosyltransferase
MYKQFFKRFLDFFVALIAVFILSPIFVLICIILVLTGEHEVFYLQNRVGFKNKFFKIWKFATMLKKSPDMGTGSLTLRNDPRVLPVGLFLRRTKINELPQLINVLLGNMSIVGPRPQMEVDFLKFSPAVQKVIYNTPPGITGIGSIIFRDEEKWISQAQGDPHEFYKIHIAPYKGELEVWYQTHLTFYTDMMLVFLTAWVIISPSSQLVDKVFKDLPKRPPELE